MKTLPRNRERHTAQKMKFSIKDFFSTEEILNGNFIFCAVTWPLPLFLENIFVAYSCVYFISWSQMRCDKIWYYQPRNLILLSLNCLTDRREYCQKEIFSLINLHTYLSGVEKLRARSCLSTQKFLNVHQKMCKQIWRLL